MSYRYSQNSWTNLVLLLYTNEKRVYMTLHVFQYFLMVAREEKLGTKLFERNNKKIELIEEDTLLRQ